jgi:hypothetical protein
VVALLVAVALAGPPKAKLVTGSGRSPLAISSWCWAARCGAPIAASTKAAVAVRGSLVSVDLAFVPTHARVAIAGQTVPATVHGRVLSWRATRAGGLTVHVTSPRGWVTYVGRLRLRAR